MWCFVGATLRRGRRSAIPMGEGGPLSLVSHLSLCLFTALLSPPPVASPLVCACVRACVVCLCAVITSLFFSCLSFPTVLVQFLCVACVYTAAGGTDVAWAAIVRRLVWSGLVSLVCQSRVSCVVSCLSPCLPLHLPACTVPHSSLPFSTCPVLGLFHGHGAGYRRTVHRVRVQQRLTCCASAASLHSSPLLLPPVRPALCVWGAMY
jgi:hypothetical protein